MSENVILEAGSDGEFDLFCNTFLELKLEDRGIYG